MTSEFQIGEARVDEHTDLGRLLVDVYSTLDGFPTPARQPAYYEMLANVGRFAERPGVKIFVARGSGGVLAGGVVYFGDMAHYGSGGTATQVRSASGIRLLGVSARCRGAGVGRDLTLACLDQARRDAHSQVVLHTTHAMATAWRMYARPTSALGTVIEVLPAERAPAADWTRGSRSMTRQPHWP
jgi:ribosomal protein S18 acetylase RimI-like enzyme